MRATKMAMTHDVGSYYWHILVYPVKPPSIIERAETQEIEGSYRGGHGWSIRLPLTRLALVIGKWHKAYDESSGLTRAIVGRAMKQDEVNWDKIRFGVEDVQEED